MHYKIKEDGQPIWINLWPKKSKRKRLDIGMKAKAGLRKIEHAIAEKKKKAKKKPYLLWGKQASGFAGYRGRQNFLWASKTKMLLKRLGL